MIEQSKAEKHIAKNYIRIAVSTRCIAALIEVAVVESGSVCAMHNATDGALWCHLSNDSRKKLNSTIQAYLKTDLKIFERF